MDGVLWQEETLKLTGISKSNCHNSVDYITFLAVALKLTGISMWSCFYWESEDGVDWQEKKLRKKPSRSRTASTSVVEKR